jgi:hypothetical protein
MKALDARRALQTTLGVKADGLIGSRTREAFETLASAAPTADWPPSEPLPRPAGWSFLKAYVSGKDIVVVDASTTWFGGDNDSEDAGETACGYPTKGHPDLLGCALPCDGYGVRSLKGSPLPKLPFGLRRDGSPNPGGTMVEVTYKTRAFRVPFIDLGPSGYTRNALDLTKAVFRKLEVPPKTGKIVCNYRILGGAKFL